jgi:leucyl/phenylalanyl-tRNA--protein transferase
LPRDIVFTPGEPSAEGLVAVGGDLSPERLLHMYRHGVFPWYNEDCPILWWSPDPRAIFDLDAFHVPRRLRRTLRSGRFTHTIDGDFAAVIRGCADRRVGTWITPDMIAAYEKLHELGHAHSLEVWHQGELAGGIYGVALGGLFAGESMFSQIRDASKVALALLVEHLRERGYVLFDIQVITEHTARFGARNIPRNEYLRRLRHALTLTVTFTNH